MKVNILLAKELQRQLACRVRQCRLVGPVNRIAGVDVAFPKGGRQCVAGAVLMSYPELEIEETAWAVREVEMPYVPGLLSFREAPVMGDAVRKLAGKVDLLFADGQGLAHPRRVGLACHLGLELDLPAIGCAKSRLIGEHNEPAGKKGSRCRLVDGKEVIGTVLRTRDEVKPLYISVGHRVTLEEAVKVVLACCNRYRLPEPTRQAHLLVSRLRKETLPPFFADYEGKSRR